MNLICPLCNGIDRFVEKCEICGGVMENSGKTTDFYDNYSPYLGMEITELVDGVSNNKCSHLYSCPNCNIDKRVEIDKVVK